MNLKHIQTPYIILISLFGFLFYSCDTGFYSTGRITDAATGFPVDSAKVSLKELNYTFTDSNGYYKVDTVIHKAAGQLELLIEKEGYKTRHVNFRNDCIDKRNSIITLERTDKEKDSSCLPRKLVSMMFYFNKYLISSINLLTLIFLFFKRKIKYRAIWIILVLLGNITLYISYTDCSIVKMSVLNGPVYLTHFWVYPYSVKIVIPLATLAFWGYYIFFRKNSNVF